MSLRPSTQGSSRSASGTRVVLPAPGGRDQNRVRPRAQASRQLAQNIIDRQRSIKRAHVA